MAHVKQTPFKVYSQHFVSFSEGILCQILTGCPDLSQSVGTTQHLKAFTFTRETNPSARTLMKRDNTIQRSYS